jgi:hypothetical protein
MMPRPATKVRILHFKYLRHSDMASVLITMFEIFTRASPGNSLDETLPKKQSAYVLSKIGLWSETLAD